MNYEGILEFKGTWRKYQARVKALANREERCISHKKVKGALE